MWDGVFVCVCLCAETDKPSTTKKEKEKQRAWKTKQRKMTQSIYIYLFGGGNFGAVDCTLVFFGAAANGGVSVRWHENTLWAKRK